MSMDGFILATDELPSPQSSHMKLGPMSLCQEIGYVFPIGASTDITMYRMLSRKRLDIVKESAAIADELIKKSTNRKDIKQNTEVLRNLKPIYERICARMKLDTNPEDRFTMLTCDGTIISGKYKYSYGDLVFHGLKEIETTIEFSDLFVGEGTQWVISDCIEDSVCLEAAMRCCDNKEDLLLLLRKIGAISVGEWMTPQQYLKHKEVIKHCELVGDKVFNEIQSQLKVHVETAKGRK